jgi:hypothetical protein
MPAHEWLPDLYWPIRHQHERDRGIHTEPPRKAIPDIRRHSPGFRQVREFALENDLAAAEPDISESDYQG